MSAICDNECGKFSSFDKCNIKYPTCCNKTGSFGIDCFIISIVLIVGSYSIFLVIAFVKFNDSSSWIRDRYLDQLINQKWSAFRNYWFNLLFGCIEFIVCIELSSVRLENGVASIGQSAFLGCSKLTSITIPNSVTSIGGNVFEDCIELTSVRLGKELTSIGDNVFKSCANLVSVYYNGLEQPYSVGEDIFTGCNGLTQIIVQGYYQGTTFCNIPVYRSVTQTFTAQDFFYIIL